MKVDREWGFKREAERGQPRWQYYEVSSVRGVIAAFNSGMIPEDATFTSSEESPILVTWYGWPADRKGRAEMWYLVNYERDNDTPTQKPE